ncbi:uncharacterized protein UBRO_20215 [Ustilago bromivora]|uniref:Uncharacterized protein n=1 Tax=Ustilago bromivora TaxID=307758 RepID=A0A1K0FV80_9BASI|nr:uncharacterized protein UBRO_20215 [Ustilago bromivora]SYW86306.1 uncharacterized protein UBRO2_06026 [Ustilago bromivora]
MGAFLGRYSSEGRRLRKTEPKRGEVEIKSIYKLSPEELGQLSLPQNREPKDTLEVRNELNQHTTQRGEHFGASKDIVLRYPGEEIVMRGWPVHHYFFTPRTRLDDPGPFMTYSHLSEKRKKAVDQVLRKHEFRLAAQGVYFDRKGWEGDLFIGRFDTPGHGVETLRVSSRRDFLRPWRKTPVVYRSKVSFGRIFGTPISRLPSHISSWLKDDHPEVYENLAKARLRKRALIPPQNYMTAA